ncbi:MAG: hypothetical protein Q7S53_05245 [bacterium]|nr:hypothetical protein [bacterium]
MKETNETTVEESNEELSTLKESLRQALDEGDIQRAGDLKEKILPHLEVLRRNTDIFKEAKEIMGENFFGPLEIERTFGRKLDRSEIPEIPFSREDLEGAKELRQFLILRTDKDADGKPLTIKKMDEQFGLMEEFGSDAWARKESFFNTKTPRTGWALTGRGGFKAGSYLGATEKAELWLKKYVFPNESKMPDEYRQALDEWTRKKKDIFSGTASGSGIKKRRATWDLMSLSLNKLTKHTPVELFYDSMVYFHHRAEDLYEGLNVWTNESPKDDVVCVYVGGDTVNKSYSIFCVDPAETFAQGSSTRPVFMTSFSRRS